MNKIFVYGTLKRGHGNHSLLEYSRMIGKDEAPGVVYGGYVPRMRALAEGDRGSWVKGEVYAVSGAVLKRLDRLEGHPFAYRRETVRLRSGLIADAYYWVDVEQLDDRDRIASGEWTGRANATHAE